MVLRSINPWVNEMKDVPMHTKVVYTAVHIFLDSVALPCCVGTARGHHFSCCLLQCLLLTILWGIAKIFVRMSEYSTLTDGPPPLLPHPTHARAHAFASECTRVTKRNLSGERADTFPHRSWPGCLTVLTTSDAS